MPPPPPWTRPSPLPGPIQTPRLKIRWYRPEDARALHEAVAADREALLPWLPWARKDHGSVEESRFTIEGFARRLQRGALDDFVLAIFDRGTQTLLGGTGLHRIDHAAHEAEIGYWIRGGRQGEGFATEATAGLISSAFRDWGFRRIRICCAEANVASQRVPEKLGLPLEGRARKLRYVDGIGWDDHLTYGVLAEDWDPEAGRSR